MRESIRGVVSQTGFTAEFLCMSAPGCTVRRLLNWQCAAWCNGGADTLLNFGKEIHEMRLPPALSLTKSLKWQQDNACTHGLNAIDLQVR